MDYDKYISVASWVAAIGLIISAVGVLGFRYYSGKKNSQSFADADQHRTLLKDSIDIEFNKTITEIHTQRDSIQKKIEDESLHILSNLKESSKSANRALDNLKDESIKASKEISAKIDDYERVINFQDISFYLNAGINDVARQNIETHQKKYGKVDFSLRIQFYQKINNEEILLEFIGDDNTWKSINGMIGLGNLSGAFIDGKTVRFNNYRSFFLNSTQGNLKGIRKDYPISIWIWLMPTPKLMPKGEELIVHNAWINFPTGEYLICDKFENATPWFKGELK